MNKRNQNTDFKYSKKFVKTLDGPQTSKIFDDKLPHCDQSNLKTTGIATDSSRSCSDSIANHAIKTSYMRLRSKCHCTINPFDLSSNCGDDDFLENKYSLNYKTRCSSTPKISSIATSSTDVVSSSLDLESVCWSEVDVFANNDVTNFYDFITANESNTKVYEYLDGMTGKRRLPEDVDINDVNRKKHKLTFNYEFRQRHARGPHKFRNGPSPLPIMRDSSNHFYIPEISNQTLKDLLSGRYSCYLTEFVVIDCRFPYEYEGGHVNDSLNIYTCRQLMQYLNGTSQSDMDHELDHILKLLELDNSTSNFESKAFIFYCEFSSFRGPKLAQCLRGLDKLANITFHPRLKIPNIYIVHGGYMELFGKFPEICTPEGYVSMKQTRYALRSPNNPNIFSGCSPIKPSVSSPEMDCSKFLQDITNLSIPDETTSTLYRKQQINCQRQLKSDTKRLSDIVATFTKNSDIIRLFKFDEVF